MTDNTRTPEAAGDMRQHFHQYFEFLVESERAKILGSLGCSSNDDVVKLFGDVEQRMAYLKGAIRIGKLLCLISLEEARANQSELARERTALRAACARHCGTSDPEIVVQATSAARDFRSLLKATN